MTHPLTFDNDGFLQPSSQIDTDLEALEQYFVHDFPQSLTRRRLFNNYLDYVQRFQTEIFPWFEQWVDGSFVTKKENPKDIDFVTFLDWEVFELRKSTLENFYSFNLENIGLDAYIVPNYPLGHPSFKESQILNDRYFQLFTLSREHFPKGYLKLKFENIVQ